MEVLKTVVMFPIKCIEFIVSSFYKVLYVYLIKYLLALVIIASILGLICLGVLYGYDYYNQTLQENAYYINYLLILLGAYIGAGILQVSFCKLVEQKSKDLVLYQQTEHIKLYELAKDKMSEKDHKEGYSLPSLNEAEIKAFAKQLKEKNDTKLLEELRRYSSLYKEI